MSPPKVDPAADPGLLIGKSGLPLTLVVREMRLSILSSSSPGLSDIRETNIVRKPRGKASRINVKSKCFDAHLVVDGALSYKFDDGTDVVIEIKDEDALKTVEIVNET